jgi:hypothetical protein
MHPVTSFDIISNYKLHPASASMDPAHKAREEVVSSRTRPAAARPRHQLYRINIRDIIYAYY